MKVFRFTWFCEFDHKATINNFVTKKFNVLFVTIQQFPKFISIVLCTPQNNLHCLSVKSLQIFVIAKIVHKLPSDRSIRDYTKDILTLHCIYCNKHQVILM